MNYQEQEIKNGKHPCKETKPKTSNPKKDT